MTDAPAYDAVVIGSGFGGAMAARELVRAGARVLLLERGAHVERGAHNWADDGAFTRTPAYGPDTAYRVRQGERAGRRWTEGRLCACVGGPSVFYGGASFRFREGDFRPAPEITGDSGAAWPFGYDALEPYYAEAERLLGVAGQAGADPTEPPRSGPYPHPPAPLAALSERLRQAAEALGLHPFPIPLAINHASEAHGQCAHCTTCDAFACAVGAKNDVATRVLPDLVRRGMTLRAETVAVRLVAEGERVASVACWDRRERRPVTFRADQFVLAAGALATPHLLLASGLEAKNPAGEAVGRYLMRHCNAMTYGVFPRRPNPAREHHKQVALHDFYWGSSRQGAPEGKLGNLQQVMAPPIGLLAHALPAALVPLAAPLVAHLTGLLAIAEDQPRPENGVRLDASARDEAGLPHLVVEHRHTPRDVAARKMLVREARRVLRRMGAWATVTWNVTTFSHAVGTVRMGPDERTAPLDGEGRFRGLRNLYVTDGSALPTSGGVNPSLTIAAHALRVGRRLAGRDVPAPAVLEEA